MLAARRVGTLLVGVSVLACGRTDSSSLLGYDDAGLRGAGAAISQAGGTGGAGASFSTGGVGASAAGGSGALPATGGSGGIPLIWGTGATVSTGASGGVPSTGGSGGSGGVPSTGGSGGTGGVPSTGGSGGTGGSPQSCFSDADCGSPDACLVGSCAAGLCETALRDQDADGFAAALCGGGDCNDLNPLAYPGALELCDDGTDNDCDGVADCFDPACSADPDCGCAPAPTGEACANGQDDDCDGAVDCFDADCDANPACGCEAEICDNGGDDDCDGLIDCNDDSCDGSAACACQASAEICDNGADEDCDGQIDCSDPDCEFQAACLCLVPTLEQCGNERDDDCDGLVDCGDPACTASALCASCLPEVCDDGVDNDCDGVLDCSDASCAFDPACPPTAEVCNNEIDDDFDGLTDCDDLDCSAVARCLALQNTCATAELIVGNQSGTYQGSTLGQSSNFEGSCGGDAGEAVFLLRLNEPTRVHLDTVGSSFDTNLYLRRGSCDRGEEIACDDDGGGSFWSSALDIELLQPGDYFIFVDGLTVDPVWGIDEGPYLLNVALSPPAEVCGDGRDNDGDALSDCADTDCAFEASCLGCNSGAPAVREVGRELCTDGLDNDCDGLSDCADDDCSASQLFTGECCNGSDQNGNGIADDFNCRCASDADCGGGQLCYSSTVGACGIPCDSFVGEICPFVAPGSACNSVTHQCEF